MSRFSVRVSPPKLGGVAVRQRKDATATSARTDGVVPKPRFLGMHFDRHSEALRLWNHPVRSAEDADAIFLWSRPPLLTQEGIPARMRSL